MSQTASAPVASDPLFGTPPALPYGGTTGHAAGPGPSGERARAEAADGTAARRQAAILTLLSDAGPVGMTADELAAKGIAPHRSAVSAHTSSLHSEGRIACLKERRGKSGIYVLPQYVNGRPTRAFAGKGAGPQYSARDAADVLAEAHSEIERLTAENRRLTASVSQRLNAEVHKAATFALTDEEVTLLTNLEEGLKRRRDQGIVSLRKDSVVLLAKALRRADSRA